jgi:hypothetical protein
MLAGEDLIDEIEDPAMNGGFDEQHQMLVPADRAEQVEVFERVADARWRTQSG